MIRTTSVRIPRFGKTLKTALLLGGVMFCSVLTPALASSTTTLLTVPMSYTDWSRTLTLAQFNPAQGTLTAVDLLLSGSVDNTLRIENTSPNGSMRYTSTLDTSLILTKPDDTVLLLTGLTFTNSGTLAKYDGTRDFAGTSGFTLSQSVSNSLTQTLTGAALADFIGIGTTSFDLDSSAWFSFRGGGNMMMSVSTLAGATLSVTYDFIPNGIPAPGSLALLLGGLGGVAVAVWGHRQTLARLWRDRTPPV